MQAMWLFPFLSFLSPSRFLSIIFRERSCIFPPTRPPLPLPFPFSPERGAESASIHPSDRDGTLIAFRWKDERRPPPTSSVQGEAFAFPFPPPPISSLSVHASSDLKRHCGRATLSVTTHAAFTKGFLEKNPLWVAIQNSRRVNLK